MTEPFDTYMHLGLIAAERNQYDEAAAHYKSALVDAEKRQDPVDIYLSKCKIAKNMGLLEKYSDCEKSFKEALQIFRTEKLCANENVTLMALSGLIDLYAYQERNADLENILLEELDFNHRTYGHNSAEFLAIYNTLAIIYTRTLKEPEKAIVIYEFIMDYERSSGKLTALGETIHKYAEALDLANRKSEAAAARAEYKRVQEQIKNAATKPQQRPFLEIKRDDFKSGKITKEQFRKLVLEEIASRALEEEPLLEEYNEMLNRHGCPANEAAGNEAWKDAFKELINEFSLSDEEINASAREMIKKLEENLLSWNSSWG